MDDSKKGDEMLKDTHIKTPEINLEVPHQHNDSLMAPVMNKHNERMNIDDEHDSDVMTTNEDSKTNVETSNSTIYDTR